VKAKLHPAGGEKERCSRLAAAVLSCISLEKAIDPATIAFSELL
jgi:hypothetical protein